MKTNDCAIEEDVGEIMPIYMAEKVEEIDKGDLAAQMADPESDLGRHLEKLSAWMAWQCGQDQNDLKQTLCLKVWSKKDSIHSFIGWLNTTASNGRKNIYRHKDVENAYLEKSSVQPPGDTKRNGRLWVQSTSVLTPEQELLDKERQRQLADIVRRVLGKFPPDIVEKWAMEKTPKEIAEETGKPISTVYRVLGNMEKAIVKAREELEIPLYGK